MPDSSKLQKLLSSGKYDRSLSQMYGKDRVRSARERYMHVIKRYNAVFGPSDDLHLFSSPGRIEISGNHTDHQHGCALAAAIDLDIAAAVSANNSNRIVLVSDGYRKLTINLSDLRPKKFEQGTSAALIRGIASRLKATGYKIGGFNIYTLSDVPAGSGMSSSAAFEVLIGTVLSHLYNKGSISAHKIALTGQYSENIYFGKPCGLLDQMASACGGLVYIDFNNPKKPMVSSIEGMPEHFDCDTIIVNTGKSHSSLSAQYAAVLSDMRAAALAMGRNVLRQVDEAAFYRSIPKVRKKAGDRAVLRAMHYFAENKRPTIEAEALRRGDMEVFLRTVSESGRSSFMYNQNIYADARNQNLSIALGLCDKLLNGRGAFRVHGGGFEGTVEAFVPSDMTDEFIDHMERCFGSGCCYRVRIRPCGGMRLT